MPGIRLERDDKLLLTLSLNVEPRVVYMKMNESEVAHSCPTLCDPVDCNLPGSSVHGILQARVLEWAAISFPDPGIEPRSPALQANALTSEPPGKPHI